MAKFIDDIQLPVSDTQLNPDPGYKMPYFTDEGYFWKDPDGTKHKIATLPLDVTVYIQDEKPDNDGLYFWIQTNVNSDGDFTFWFTDPC